MKLFFSSTLLIFLASLAPLYAMDIFLITHSGQKEKILKILKKADLIIPSDLIVLRELQNPCEVNLDTIMHICFEKEDFKILNQKKSSLRRIYKSFEL